MTGAWSTAEASVAAQEALDVLGTGPQELQLLRLGENALYRIVDTNLILRVARAGTDPRDISRTITVASTLRTLGVPVCEPAPPQTPMPFKNGVVSVWTYYAESSCATTDYGEFGRILRSLHDNGDGLGEMLPTWDPLGLTRARLDAVGRIGVPRPWIHDLVRRANDLERGLASYEPVLSSGVIHGDAHTGNALNTANGLILIDLDNLSNGPRDADFAPTMVQLRRFGLDPQMWIAFITGYGLPDPWMLQDSPLVRLRELFMLAWLLQPVR